MGWLSLITVLLQLASEILKMRETHRQNLGAPKLPPEERKRIDQAVVAAVQTKNTAGLEAILRAPAGQPLPADPGLAPTVMSSKGPTKIEGGKAS